jgi:death-on-curing protein
MRYLTVTEVARINEVEAGPGLLVDFARLESAVLRPQSSVGGEDAYPGVHEQAAALMHSLARNHAFIDGNKRTAAAAMIVFFRLNGYGFHCTQDELVALTTDAAEGLLDVVQIAAQLKSWAFDELDLSPDE